jgi:hypothetical protein
MKKGTGHWPNSILSLCHYCVFVFLSLSLLQPPWIPGRTGSITSLWQGTGTTSREQWSLQARPPSKWGQLPERMRLHPGAGVIIISWEPDCSPEVMTNNFSKHLPELELRKQLITLRAWQRWLALPAHTSAPPWLHFSIKPQNSYKPLEDNLKDHWGSLPSQPDYLVSIKPSFSVH